MKAESNLTTEIKQIINETFTSKDTLIDAWESIIKLEKNREYYHIIQYNHNAKEYAESCITKTNI